MVAERFKCQKAPGFCKKISDLPNPLDVHAIIDIIISHLTFAEAQKASGINRLWKKIFRSKKWKEVDLTNQSKFGDKNFRLLLKEQRYGKKNLLRRLSLIGTAVNAKVLSKKTQQLTGISTLELGGKQVPSQEYLIPLRGLYNLEVLTIVGSNTLGAQGLALIKELLAGLTCLHLPHSKNLDDAALREIAMHCSRLKCLNIRCCNKITDTGLHPVLKCCTAMECLDVSNTMTMSYLSCMDIRVYSRNLKYIKAGRTRLSGCGCDLLVLAANEKRFDDFYLSLGDHKDNSKTSSSPITDLSHCIQNWKRA